MNFRHILGLCAVVIACPRRGLRRSVGPGLLTLLIATSACEDAARPVEPVWGKQACSHCAMLLSDPRFGAELTTEEGERYFFDDPGCMAAFVHARSPRVHAMWVHLGPTWIDAKTARYERAASPMDYGLAPSKTGTATWSDVVLAATERGGES